MQGRKPGTGAPSSVVYGVAILGLVALTAAVYLVFPGANHNGKIAGNLATTVAGVWGLCGLSLALIDRFYPRPDLRTTARLVLAGALAYLAYAALMGNARWALWFWRLPAYAAVLGSTWTAEYLLRKRPDDSQTKGLLALVATALSYGVVSFEVVRWLEPAFTLESGAGLTPAVEAWQESTRLFWTTTLWGVCSTLTLVAGAHFKSQRTRLLGVALAVIALAWTAGAGIPNPAAASDLRGAAFVTLIFGSLYGAYKALQEAEGRERVLLKGLEAVALIVALLWIIQVLQ